ncbi:MAG: MYXO-CTERM sorting domain-containing protein [Myxococcota bacterium]
MRHAVLAIVVVAFVCILPGKVRAQPCPSASQGESTCGFFTLDLMCSEVLQPHEPVYTWELCGEQPDADFRAHADGNRRDGLLRVSVPEAGINVSAPPGAIAITFGQDVAEAIWWMSHEGQRFGLSLPDGLTTLENSDDKGSGAYVVAEDEIDFNFGPLEVPSLEVHGLLIVIGGGITVEGDATIDGAVYTTGAFTSEELEVKSNGVGALRYGGMLFTMGLEATKVTLDHAMLYSRGIGIVLPPPQASVLVTESLLAHESLIDAADSLTARTSLGLGAPIQLVDTELTTRAIEGGVVQLGNCKVFQPTAITARYFSAHDTEIQASAQLILTVTWKAITADVVIRTEHLLAELDDADLRAGTLIDTTEGGEDDRYLPAPEEDWAMMLELHAGGSYGGYGGSHGNLVFNGFAPAPPPQGSAHDPDAIGPGPGGYGIRPIVEGAFDDGRGGKGGGWIQLHARKLRWNGEARANGGDAIGTAEGKGGGGGGAGGSISFRVDEALTGSGVLRANGGNGSYGMHPDVNSITAGGGSGGRILVHAGDMRRFTGNAEALGGQGPVTFPQDEGFALPWWDSRTFGGPGTIHYRDDSGLSRIIIDGGGVNPDARACPVESFPRCGGVGILSGDHGGDDVILRHAVVVTDGLTARSITLERATLMADNQRVRLPWPTKELYGRDENGPQLVAWGWAVPGAVWREPLDERVTLTVTEDLVVDAESAIDLSGQGGYSQSAQIDDGNYNWTGGSHGGTGTAGRINGVALGSPDAVYDDPAAPTEPGRGGYCTQAFQPSQHPTANLAGEGGGALRVNAGGAVVVDGSIRADGFPGLGYDGTPGGAGGAIWITATTIRGGGEISVAGGRGMAIRGDDPLVSMGGGGGGGRVAMDGDVSGLCQAPRAPGGAGGEGPGVGPDVLRGSEGTVYVNGAPIGAWQGCGAVPPPVDDGTPPPPVNNGQEDDTSLCSSTGSPPTWMLLGTLGWLLVRRGRSGGR